MTEHANRVTAALYDQFEDEHRVADWGGDELFTRMPRPRAVDDAPPPRFRPHLAASGTAPAARPAARPPERPLALVETPGDQRGAPESEPLDRRRAAARAGASGPLDGRRALSAAEEAMSDRARRLGLSVVEPAREPTHRWDESGRMIEPEPAGRRTAVITGHPGGVARPLPTVRAERRRPPRTPVEWVGARPERIVAWAFVLGLLLILIAISTADAATL